DKQNTAIYYTEKFIKKGYELISFNEFEREKSIKNETELKNIMISHIFDGQAICNFIYWLKQTNNKKAIDEITIINKLEKYRTRSTTDYLGPSFPAIVGFQENGAIIHYRATNQSCKKISGGGLLLIDSGGQYKYGTTDMTRTFLIGDTNKDYSRLYTIVLKAHIALASKTFDSDTTGSELDKSSREIIESYGYNYNHGTGHGVGYLLSVHEGPLSISPRESRSGFSENMLFSNEPGIYIEGELGIRIENLMIIRKNTASDNLNKLYFETISFAPFERNLIDRDILDENEVDWVNNYHETVYKKLNKGLDIETKEWLRKETAPI
ncbi:MAG: M24 family metallopeptidase, partial [Alphaproteobacteria bacterium]|nr:M24 family metallopeptidase [Alphaproteobacteria bacterium]